VRLATLEYSTKCHAGTKQKSIYGMVYRCRNVFFPCARGTSASEIVCLADVVADSVGKQVLQECVVQSNGAPLVRWLKLLNEEVKVLLGGRELNLVWPT